MVIFVLDPNEGVDPSLEPNMTIHFVNSLFFFVLPLIVVLNEENKMNLKSNITRQIFSMIVACVYHEYQMQDVGSFFMFQMN